MIPEVLEGDLGSTFVAAFLLSYADFSGSSFNAKKAVKRVFP